MKTIKLRYLFMILVMCFGALSVSAQSDIPLLGPSRATKPLSAKERRNVDKTINQTNTNRDNVAINEDSIVANAADIAAMGDSLTTDELVQFRLAKGGTPIAGTNMSRTFRATSTDSAIPLNWLTELATNEYIEVYGTSDTNADNFTINNLTLTVVTH